mmetsp:Transcript_71938/g.114021  ORF Transcript_71938/g.114021 Transcript_71938/m.114021 type:complete len:283 (-) Transcript_71938:42-890(-)
MAFLFGGTEPELENEENPPDDAELLNDIDLEELGVTDGADGSRPVFSGAVENESVNEALKNPEDVDVDELAATDKADTLGNSRGAVERSGKVSRQISFDSIDDSAKTPSGGKKKGPTVEIGDELRNQPADPSSPSNSSNARNSRTTKVFAKSHDQRKNQLDEIVQMLEDQNAELARIRVDHAERLQMLRARHEAVCRCLETAGYSTYRRTKAKQQSFIGSPGALQKSSLRSIQLPEGVRSAPGQLAESNEALDSRASQMSRLEPVDEEETAAQDDFNDMDAF